jgi:UDP-N-acetylmuramyl pentapeptide phosphotransferase/UDP-N-acetylglucosamine-1-phosphate transferase
MGDSGSMFLGLLLASAAITLTGQVDPNAISAVEAGPTLLPLLLPFAVLAIPLADLVLAISRRLLAGRSPFAPDKNHLHHRLLALGLNHMTTSIIMYLLTVVFIVYSMLLRNLNPTSHFLILFFTGLIVLHFFPKVLGFFLKKTIANHTLTTPK